MSHTDDKTRDELLRELATARDRVRKLESRLEKSGHGTDQDAEPASSPRDHYDYLQSLIETIPDLVWLKDTRGVYLACNPAFERFFGATQTQIKGRTDHDFVDKELADFFLEHDRLAMEADKPCTNEEWLVFATDGYSGLFETIKTPMRDSSGRVIGVLGIARDISLRKQAEDKLRESEERFRQIYEHMAVGVARVSLDYIVEAANEAYCRMLGYGPEEIVGKHLKDFTHPEMIEENLEKQRMLSKGEINHFRLEKKFIHKNGNTIVGVLDANLVRGPEGVPLYFLGSVLDITGLKRAEDDLRESEAKLKNIVDGTPIPTFVIDKGHELVHWNRAMEKLCGIPAAQVLGTSDQWTAFYPSPRPCLCDLVLNGDADEIARYYPQSHGSGEEPETVEVTAFFPSMPTGGKWLHITSTPIKDSSQTVIGALETMSDITEAKLADEKLRITKQELESIFENSQVGIMLLRGGRTLARGNRRLAELLGYDGPEEMAGLSMRQLHLGEKRFREFGDRFYYTLAKGENIQVEYQLRRKDGSAAWCSLSGKALDPSDLDKGVIWVVDDLEPRKALENGMLQAKKQAEDASRAKSEFLANMSHEIRTPLNGIMGILQLLTLANLDSESMNYVTTGLSSCRRLSTLLGDILDLSRIESGKMPLVSEPFTVREVFDSVDKLFSPSAIQAGLELKVRLDDSIPVLAGDPNRLLQVLNNLVGNAIKFTSSGEITLQAHQVPVDTPSVCQVLISVSDTGMGIPDDKVGHIFQPFIQAANRKDQLYEGAGLGLSICRHLVTFMGGTIAVDSEPGQGTTFHVNIPFEIHDKPVSLPGKNESRALDNGVKLRVLLVEDDPTSRFAVKRQLQAMGHEVVTADNGEQAMEHLRETRFDAIFMDLRMPVMNGVEATMAIREGKAGQRARHTLIVAMTAYAMEEDREKALNAGMDGFIAKPVNMDKLREVLESLPEATETRNRDSLPGPRP